MQRSRRSETSRVPAAVECLEQRRLLAANVIELAIPAQPLARGTPLALTATLGESDVATKSVDFFIDSNKNGQFDAADKRIGSDRSAAGGYAVTLGGKTTLKLPANEVRFFAQAKGKDGSVGEAAAATLQVDNAAPTLGSISVTPKKLQRGKPITVHLGKVRDPDGKVVQAELYSDANANGQLDEGETLLAAVTSVRGRFQFKLDSRALQAGTTALLARVADADGAWSNTVATSFELPNLPPTIKSLSAPKKVSDSSLFVLRANGLVDRDGAIQEVHFFHDTNNNGVWDEEIDEQLGASAGNGPITGGMIEPFEPVDEVDGYAIIVDAMDLPVGINRYFAVAYDTEGGRSAPRSVTNTIVPEAGGGGGGEDDLGGDWHEDDDDWFF